MSYLTYLDTPTETAQLFLFFVFLSLSLLFSVEYPLLGSWRKYLPQVDHQWVSKALFKWSTTGKPEVAYSHMDKLWWHPPEPHLSSQVGKEKQRQAYTGSQCGFCGCVALSEPSNYSFALTSMSFRDLPLL